MKKCLDMSMDAGQEHAIQTFDQQLYAIAQQVKWSGNKIQV
jgi:Tfp pilus assembly ATPase PilU